MDNDCVTKSTHLLLCNKLVYQDGLAYFICSTCEMVIKDKFYLRVGSKVYHETCLQCSICQIILDDKSTCFLKSAHILCPQDYHKYFANKCSNCHRFIYPNNWIRRAGDHVYHLTCFSCSTCERQLSTDEEYALENGHIFCKTHAIEHNENIYDEKTTCETKRIRTAFTREQLKILQANFKVDPNPDGKDLEWVAQLAGLSKRVIQIWFQNTRARQKKILGQNFQHKSSYRRHQHKKNGIIHYQTEADGDANTQSTFQ